MGTRTTRRKRTQEGRRLTPYPLGNRVKGREGDRKKKATGTQKQAKGKLRKHNYTMQWKGETFK